MLSFCHLKPAFTIVIFIQFRRNSRLAVDEDLLQCVANEKVSVLKQLYENVRSKPSRCRKLSDTSELENYALMHLEDLKGYYEFVFFIWHDSLQ